MAQFQVTPTLTGSSPIGHGFMVPAVAQSNGHGRLASFPSAPDIVAKQAIKLTSSDGVKQTLLTLYEFNILLKRVIQGSVEDMPVLSLDEYNQFFSERSQQDIRKVTERREGIEQRAIKHQDLLLHYHTYLRGILDELAKSNLTVELEQIELALKGRVLPKEASSSSSLSSSPLKSSHSNKDPEQCSPLQEAWEKVGELGELKAQLAALRTKFAFIDEDCPEDVFAQECRKNGSVLFLNRFQEFNPERSDKSDSPKGWQRSELIKVMKAITEAYLALKSQIDLTEFLPSNDDLPLCKLSARVTAISEEFAGNALLSQQVDKFRELSLAIARQKEIVLIENKSEHLREAEDRQRLHNRTVKELGVLKAEVLAMDIGRTMDTIRELMDKAVKESDCIKKMFDHVKRTMGIFDETMSSSST